MQSDGNSEYWLENSGRCRCHWPKLIIKFLPWLCRRIRHRLIPVMLRTGSSLQRKDARWFLGCSCKKARALQALVQLCVRVPDTNKRLCQGMRARAWLCIWWRWHLCLCVFVCSDGCPQRHSGNLATSQLLPMRAGKHTVMDLVLCTQVPNTM